MALGLRKLVKKYPSRGSFNSSFSSVAFGKKDCTSLVLKVFTSEDNSLP